MQLQAQAQASPGRRDSAASRCSDASLSMQRSATAAGTAGLATIAVA